MKITDFVDISCDALDSDCSFIRFAKLIIIYMLTSNIHVAEIAECDGGIEVRRLVGDGLFDVRRVSKKASLFSSTKEFFLSAASKTGFFDDSLSYFFVSANGCLVVCRIARATSNSFLIYAYYDKCVCKIAIDGLVGDERFYGLFE